MNRFDEQPASALAGNYARHRFAKELYESASRPLQGPTCENCDQVVDRVTHVPEFDYMGCDDCRLEAEAQIAREAAHGAMLAETGRTVAESAAFAAVTKPIGRQQGETNFGEVA